MALHLVSGGDVGGHALSAGCWCLPRVETTARPDGVYGRLVEHRDVAAVEEIADLRSENA